MKKPVEQDIKRSVTIQQLEQWRRDLERMQEDIRAICVHVDRVPAMALSSVNQNLTMVSLQMRVVIDPGALSRITSPDSKDSVRSGGGA